MLNAATQLHLRTVPPKRLAYKKTVENLKFIPQLNDLLDFIPYQPLYHLARLLGVLVKFNYDGFDLSQTHLAEIYAAYFPKQRDPSRFMIGRWLGRLAELNLIEIPRSHCYSEYATKPIYFTDVFKDFVLKRAPLTMCDTGLHVAESLNTQESYSDPTDSVINNNLVTKNRGREDHHKSAPEPPAPLVDNIIPEQEPESKPPPKPRNFHKKLDLSKSQKRVLWGIANAGNTLSKSEIVFISKAYIDNPNEEICQTLERYMNDENGWTESEKIGGARQFLSQLRAMAGDPLAETLKKLSKVKNKKFKRALDSILWWLRSSWTPESITEGVNLQALFAYHIDDPKISKFIQLWKSWDKTKKPRAINRLVKYLRTLDFVTGKTEPIETVTENVERDPELTELISACAFGTEYNGPGLEIYEKFQTLDDCGKDDLLDDLVEGKIAINP